MAKEMEECTFQPHLTSRPSTSRHRSKKRKISQFLKDQKQWDKQRKQTIKELKSEMEKSHQPSHTPAIDEQS